MRTERIATLSRDLQESCDGADERRAAPRFRGTLVLSCRPLDESSLAAGLGQVRDISTLGVAFYFPTPLEMGALVEIEFVKNASYAPNLLARVVHVAGEERGGALIGCAFVQELTDQELRVFQAERVQPDVPDVRRWVRFPCNVETVCYTSETAPGERRPARIVNISAGGVGLLLPCQFVKGTLLRFVLPIEADQGRDLLVRVLREMEHRNGYWFHGCEFVHQLGDEELRDLLRR